MSTSTGMRNDSTEVHGAAATACAVVLFWLAAATLTIVAHTTIDPHSTSGGAVATILSIVGMAWAYTRLYARSTTLSHALGVGIAWLALTTAAEIAITSALQHSWYSLIGSPLHPLLRNIFLFVWVFAPALFSDREASE